ncbi:hypothetical protein [Methanobacterium ferruginis]|nr:hypothetical protein [Methanobacterium ferruginis]
MGLKIIEEKQEDYTYRYIIHTIFGFTWNKVLVEIEGPDGTQRFI